MLNTTISLPPPSSPTPLPHTKFPLHPRRCAFPLLSYLVSALHLRGSPGRQGGRWLARLCSLSVKARKLAAEARRDNNNNNNGACMEKRRANPTNRLGWVGAGRRKAPFYRTSRHRRRAGGSVGYYLLGPFARFDKKKSTYKPPPSQRAHQKKKTEHTYTHIHTEKSTNHNQK